MGRNKRTYGRKIVVEDQEGNPVEFTAGNFIDLTEPQADLDTNIIPEFVNISSKIQCLCIPNQPNSTMIVRRFAIIRGAQWRSMTIKSRNWMYPPFIERVPNKEGKFDEKYLLTEKQMIDEIEQLIRRKALSELIDNAVLTQEEPDPPPGVDPEPLVRLQEDRPKVTSVAMTRLVHIQKLDEERRKALGITDALS